MEFLAIIAVILFELSRQAGINPSRMKPSIPGKGLGVPANQADIQPKVKAIRVTTSQKRTNKKPTSQDDIFAEIEQAIRRNGYRSIKLAMLLRRFGFQRRSAQRIKRHQYRTARARIVCSAHRYGRFGHIHQYCPLTLSFFPRNICANLSA